MKTDYEPFDVAADYLVSEARIAGYLSAAAEDEDPNVLLLALCDAAKARGMMEVAKAAGLNRESLYKALKPGAHPRFETVQAVLRALGVKLAVSARAGEAREAPDTQADEARLTQLVEEVVESDKSATAQVKETPGGRAVTIEAFKPTHQPKTAAEETARKAAAKKPVLKKARAEAAKASTKAQPTTPAKQRA